MNDIYNRLLSLCNQKGISGARMCRDCGFSKSLMSDLKAERREVISFETALKLAEYFDTSVDFIMRGDQSGIKKEPITEDDELVLDAQEKAFILWLRSLPPEKRQAVLNFQDMF